MSEAHHRKKQPLLVRRQVLEVAARLATEQGLAAVTMDSVSQAAGISKGGLLHHFPNKVALLDGLFDRLIDDLDAAIEAEMRADPVPQGRFTRAYLQAVMRSNDHAAEAQQWAGLTMALLTEPHLRIRWRAWVEERGNEYVGTDSTLDALIVRFAVDGLWLAELIGSHAIGAEQRARLAERLGELSHR